ncbi:MAG: tetratricopeptide repeat protein [Gemmatimonadaceae bacterium]
MASDATLPLPTGSIPERTSAAFVAALAIASSATSLSNGFAFDDVAIILGNERVHQLTNWWTLFVSSYWPPSLGESLYRPMTMLAFALQWAIGKGSPGVFHAVSIGLYAASCVLAYHFFRELLSQEGAVVAAVLFAVHPVHVEAVGNVVGQSELWAALAVLAACLTYVRARKRGTFSSAAIATIALAYLAGALFKEHALLLPLLLIAIEAFAVRDDRPLAARARTLTPLFLVLLLAGVAILAARMAVVGSLIGEKQVVEMDPIERVWMMFRVAPEWVRLMLWPAHLSAYYGPRDITIDRGPTLLNALGVGLLVLSVVAFVVARRRSPRVSFAIAWLAVTLFPASNLLSGFILEEHTLFLPSVGAVMLVGLAWEHVVERRVAPAQTLRLTATALVLAAMAAGIVRSAGRQRVWRDNMSLFAATVRDAPMSYRAHYLYGTTLFEAGQLKEGERELQTAMRLDDKDADPYNYLATKYREAKVYQLAIPLYQRALSLNPSRPDARFGLAYSLFERGDIASARAHADTGLAQGQLRSYFQWILAKADSVNARVTPPR